MGDWQDLGNLVFIGLIFSFLVAKLISVVFRFKDGNLKLVREADLRLESDQKVVTSNVEDVNEAQPLIGASSGEGEVEGGLDVLEKQEELNLSESYLGEDEDDWEGVESTELDEEFSAASTFVAEEFSAASTFVAAAAGQMLHKVSNEVQLQVYGLYKIATEGPCNTPQPNALKMSARAKWNAWQRLGVMPAEDAMAKYIQIVDEIYPTWAAGSSSKNKDGENNTSNSTSQGTMGPVFSTFVHEESDNELMLDAIHAAAREGERDNLLKYLDSGVSVNLKDSEGRTPLHWAVDRGHLNIAELLVSKKADVNAMDNEGQTPLHYAAMCERETIAEFLLKENADTSLKDSDGNCPGDVCESNWPWMHHSSGKSAE